MGLNFKTEIANGDQDITGLDLHIDNSIQKICEVANSTSGNIRSVWYIIVIVATLSFAEFWNTQPKNWSTGRIKDLEDSIYQLKNKLLTENHTNSLASISDTSRIKHQIELYEDYLSLFRGSAIQNIQTVRIPILSNAFDVNDLGIFAGFSFIVLLLILDFTLMRKVSNLKIALKSISKRYPENSDEKFFEDFLLKQKDKTKALDAINFIRRKYHFDFLSMNENFIVPSGLKRNSAWMEFLRKQVFLIPFFMSLILLINDLILVASKSSTSGLEGWHSFKMNYIFLVCICVVYIFFIFRLGKKCKKESELIETLYINFQKDNYKYSSAYDELT
jgi:hypothetical protein